MYFSFFFYFSSFQAFVFSELTTNYLLTLEKNSNRIVSLIWYKNFEQWNPRSFLFGLPESLDSVWMWKLDRKLFFLFVIQRNPSKLWKFVSFNFKDYLSFLQEVLVWDVVHMKKKQQQQVYFFVCWAVWLVVGLGVVSSKTFRFGIFKLGQLKTYIRFQIDP